MRKCLLVLGVQWSWEPCVTEGEGGLTYQPVSDAKPEESLSQTYTVLYKCVRFLSYFYKGGWM